MWNLSSAPSKDDDPPNLVCPQPEHAPEWDQNGNDVGHLEHAFGVDRLVLLNVPERIARKDRGGRL